MGGVERREEPVTSNTVFSKFLVGFICPVRWHPQDDGRYGAEAVAAAVWPMIGEQHHRQPARQWLLNILTAG